MRYAARMKNFGVDTPNTKTVTKTLCFFGVQTFHHLAFIHPTVNHGHLITRRLIT